MSLIQIARAYQCPFGSGFFPLDQSPKSHLDRTKARKKKKKKSLVAAKESAEDEFKTNLGKIFNEQNPSNQLTKEQIKNIDISKLNTTLNTSFNPATLRKSPLVGEDNDVQKAYYD